MNNFLEWFNPFSGIVQLVLSFVIAAFLVMFLPVTWMVTGITGARRSLRLRARILRWGAKRLQQDRRS